MKTNADVLTGVCIGLLGGFGIFLFFFTGSVNVNVYTCYQKILVPEFDKPSMVCYGGQGGNPCVNAERSSNYSGLVDYNQIKLYLVDPNDKVLNISLNGGLE